MNNAIKSLFFAIVLASAWADDYLKELEEAAQSVLTVAEMRHGQIKAVKRELKADQSARQAFEALLKRRYRGSYEIYRGLDEADKLDIIFSYTRHLPMFKIKWMIVDRKIKLMRKSP